MQVDDQAEIKGAATSRVLRWANEVAESLEFDRWLTNDVMLRGATGDLTDPARCWEMCEKITEECCQQRSADENAPLLRDSRAKLLDAHKHASGLLNHLRTLTDDEYRIVFGAGLEIQTEQPARHPASSPESLSNFVPYKKMIEGRALQFSVYADELEVFRRRLEVAAEMLKSPKLNRRKAPTIARAYWRWMLVDRAYWVALNAGLKPTTTEGGEFHQFVCELALLVENETSEWRGLIKNFHRHFREIKNATVELFGLLGLRNPNENRHRDVYMDLVLSGRSPRAGRPLNLVQKPRQAQKKQSEIDWRSARIRLAYHTLQYGYVAQPRP